MKIKNITQLLLILVLFSSFNYNLKEDPKIDIIGTWYYENNTTSKLIFTSDSKIHSYYNGNTLRYSAEYSISHNCGSSSDINFYFLKIIYSDGDEECFEINGINENNSGILSLTSMKNGKIHLLINDPSIEIPD